MATSFERGRIAGQWTEAQVKELGYISAKECLEEAEEYYLEELENLKDLSPEYAAKHAEYLEGFITGERESLRRLL